MKAGFLQSVSLSFSITYNNIALAITSR